MTPHSSLCFTFFHVIESTSSPEPFDLKVIEGVVQLYLGLSSACVLDDSI